MLFNWITVFNSFIFPNQPQGWHELFHFPIVDALNRINNRFEEFPIFFEDMAVFHPACPETDYSCPFRFTVYYALFPSSGRADLEEGKGRLKGSSAGRAVFEEERGRDGPCVRPRLVGGVPGTGAGCAEPLEKREGLARGGS